jgi:5-methylcytosine-specific restriction endonuclease McrA
MTYTYKYKQMRKAILKRDDHTCAYCGQLGNQIDHIIPISKGGEDHESNMTTACATCNASKKDKDARTFTEKKYAEKYTQIKPKTDFLQIDSTRTHSLVSLSPRDFGVFEAPLFEEKQTG